MLAETQIERLLAKEEKQKVEMEVKEMDDFQKECDERVKRIAEELNNYYDGFSDEINKLREKVDKLEDDEPEEPDQLDDESDEDYDKRYEEWEKEWEKWEQERDELEDKINELEDEGNLRSYFDDYLDVDYVVNSRREYKSAIICIGWGGPNIYIDTEEAKVRLYWGCTRAEYPIRYEVRDVIDAIFEEYYDMVV